MSLNLDKVSTVKELAARVSTLEREVADLRRFAITIIRRERPLMNERNLTDDRISEEDIKEAIKLAGGPELISDSGLGSVFCMDPRKIGVTDGSENRLFPVKGYGPYVYVSGPGQILVGKNQFLKPVWGPLGVFPYLVKMKIPFFNGQHNFTEDITRQLYHGMCRAEGSAILVFYEQPFNSVWETATLAWFLATGAPKLFFVMQASLQSGGHYSDDRYPNFTGFPAGKFTLDERQLEVYRMISLFMDLYKDLTKTDISGRKFGEYHMVDGATVRDQLILRDTGAPGRSNTLGSRIEAGGILVESGTPPVSEEIRRRWLKGVRGLALKTDIALLIQAVFELALYLSIDTDGELANEQRGIVQGYLMGFSAAAKDTPHRDWALPVVRLLNLMLEEYAIQVTF